SRLRLAGAAPWLGGARLVLVHVFTGSDATSEAYPRSHPPRGNRLIGTLKGLVQTWKTNWRKPVTVQYPDERLPLQPRYMGFPGLMWDDEHDEPFCTGCQ